MSLTAWRPTPAVIFMASATPSAGFTAYGIVVGKGALVGQTGLYCAYSHVTVYRDASGYRIWNRE
ncbi:hypothetical protein EDD27_7712 [Nonomuraea polychroma]|uniref:Uncharacterized protein n=1 Tax=Nonomuraea polychroma TaxID=46176 RepID=A0A438MGI1_9ACTN|nr:hypothetical protein EDD27_7712 [Nonomuraea polychroma]